ncbi:MAG: PaREP1 family protein [Candidatus Methanomethylicia archaeon]
MSFEELIKSALEFVELAFRKFEEGVKENSSTRLRDSAEKTWNAVAQAINALVLRYEELMPRSHYERRHALKELEKKIPKLKDYGIYDRYAARSCLLHGEVFYEGIIDTELLKLELEKPRELVEYISKNLSRFQKT